MFDPGKKTGQKLLEEGFLKILENTEKPYAAGK
jgi:hypothetical protein